LLVVDIAASIQYSNAFVKEVVHFKSYFVRDRIGPQGIVIVIVILRAPWNGDWLCPKASAADSQGGYIDFFIRSTK
jgi:hypothetical protein